MTGNIYLHAAARSWLGVPFRHQGRSRSGVDCAGLVIMVARETGIVPPTFDVNGYRRVPDGSMLGVCDEHLIPAPFEEADVAVMRFREDPQHLGFLVPYRHGGQALVHALEKSGKVVEHRIDRTWRERVVRCYQWPGEG